MAITPEFLAKLSSALDELEERWRTKRISAQKAFEFALRARDRIGIDRLELAPLRKRIEVTLEAAQLALETSPVQIRRDVDELVNGWARSNNDNWKDDFFDCAALLARTKKGSPDRKRVLAVLASLLDEANEGARTNPGIAEYLGDLLDAKAWKKQAGEPLARPRPRNAFLSDLKRKARAKRAKIRSSLRR